MPDQGLLGPYHGPLLGQNEDQLSRSQIRTTGAYQSLLVIERAGQSPLSESIGSPYGVSISSA